MSDYSAAFLEHYRQPRNLGDLEHPDAVAIVHEPTCGDMVRLVVTKGGDGEPTIAQARFKAFGCAAVIAVASAATEMMVGKTVGECQQIGEAELVAAVGGLPAGRVHAAAAVGQAIAEVVARLKAGDRGESA